MTLGTGTKLGPYEVVGALGAGGMGEVYRARDTKLGREVALKVLPEEFASDAERMGRFEREAKVLASLNHPNIASIYGFEDSGGVRALVMELVEGQTLAERISGAVGAGRVEPSGMQKSHLKPAPTSTQAMPIDEALAIAKQICEGLEYAHERGIVHRDLKPANVKITPEGAVKLLDFGLAKALEGDGTAASDPSHSPTMSRLATQAGIILGTAAYMSPEQAKGKAVDRRADIWAFGCVLYEMLAGRHAFDGDTVTDVLAAVVRADPDWASLPASTPPAIRKLLKRCLQKDAKQRLRDVGEARITIEETVAGGGSDQDVRAAGGGERTERAGSPLRRALPWGVAGLFALTTLLAAVAYFRATSRPPARMQFAIPLPSEAVNIALSADGTMLAYVARDEATGADMIFAERLGAAQATRLAGTEGASYPFWSPDDQNVGFFANGELERVAISGGLPQGLVPAPHGRGGSWSGQGVILYAPDVGTPIWRVNADGSGAAPVTSDSLLPGETGHRWPAFLPDGNHFLFLAQGAGGGIYLSSLSSQTKKLIASGNSNVSYSSGHLYFEDARDDLAVAPFSAGQGKITGNVRVVAEHVTFEPLVAYGVFSAGGNDIVVYGTGAGSDTSILAWFDRSGKELGEVGGEATEANPSISPDGTRAAVDINDMKSNTDNVWIENLKAGTASKFTFDNNLAQDAIPVWSRDGQTIAYTRAGPNIVGFPLMAKSTAGLEAPRTLYAPPHGDGIFPNAWSLDDKHLLCTYEPVKGLSRLEVLNVATGKLTPFIEKSGASLSNGMISPDGKWVAYASNESGTWEIYATTFPGAQGKWQISPGGGTEPRWRGDGKELYYIDPKGMLTAVAVGTQDGFSAGAPLPLFALHGREPISDTDIFTYDVTADGKRFLVNRYASPDHVTPLTVILHPTAETKR